MTHIQIIHQIWPVCLTNNIAVARALQVEDNSSYISEKPGDGFLSDLVITEELIGKAIGDLKLGSAGGPDGLPALWLKHMCDSIKLPLSIILKK